MESKNDGDFFLCLYEFPFVAHRVKRKFYKFKLFGINLISPNTCRDERFRNKFVFKKKKRNELKLSSKKRKKRKEKWKSSDKFKKKTVSPYLAHGTRVASSIKVSTGRNDNSQFSPTTVSRCAASRKKRVPHPYWRRRGSSQGRREIGKGSDCQIEHSYYGMLDHCDSCAEQIARIEWGRT